MGGAGCDVVCGGLLGPGLVSPVLCAAEAVRILCTRPPPQGATPAIRMGGWARRLHSAGVSAKRAPGVPLAISTGQTARGGPAQWGKGGGGGAERGGPAGQGGRGRRGRARGQHERPSAKGGTRRVEGEGSRARLALANSARA